MRVVARRHVDLAAACAGDLRDDVRGRSEAVEAELLTRLDPAPPQRPVADDPGAQERRRLGVRERVGDRVGERLVHDRVFGVAAVGVPARVPRAGAEVLAAVAAERAASARARAATRCRRGPPRGTVTRLRRAPSTRPTTWWPGTSGSRCGGKIAFDDVKVGAAHAARRDAHEDLAGAGDGIGEIAERERARGDARLTLEHHRLHGEDLAGEQGFEPRFYGPEPHVLPLDDSPARLERTPNYSKPPETAVQQPVDARERPLLPEQRHDLEESRARGAPGDREAHGVDELPAGRGRALRRRAAERRIRARLPPSPGSAAQRSREHRGARARPRSSLEVLLHAVGVVVELVRSIEEEPALDGDRPRASSPAAGSRPARGGTSRGASPSYDASHSPAAVERLPRRCGELVGGTAPRRTDRSATRASPRRRPRPTGRRRRGRTPRSARRASSSAARRRGSSRAAPGS